MSTENANYITQLNETYPEYDSELANGAQHIRLIKTVLTRSFPLFSTSLTPTHTEMNRFIDLFALTDNNTNITITGRELTNIGISAVASSINPVKHYRTRYIRPNVTIGDDVKLNVNQSIYNGSNIILGHYTTGDAGARFSQPTVSLVANVVQIHGESSVKIAGEQSLDLVYPVGSIYENGSSTANPFDILGFGTWIPHGQERVGVCRDANDSSFAVPGQTGGSWTHSLTTNQLPAHSHTVNTGPTTAGYPISLAYQGGYWSSWINYYSTTKYLQSHATHLGSTYNNGTGSPAQAHNNTQASLVVARWRRTL